MIKKIIRKKLLKRHFWRYATFDELAELYTCNMLRSMASTVFGIFIPIYLYKLHYNLSHIALYYCFYFAVRFFGDILSGFATGRFGPKHTLALSYLYNIINLICLVLLPQHASLFLASALFNALGTSFMFTPIYTDFSKVKCLEHNGKEQGYFYMLESLGGAAGPIIGGFLAAQFGAQIAIIVSIILYASSLVPLMMSAEPVKTRQHITIKGFPFKKVWRDVAAYSAKATDMTILISMWPLFMFLVVFKNDAYRAIGALTTLSVVITIIGTYVFGKIIDSRHSLAFLRTSVMVESLLYLTRVLVRSTGDVVGVSIAGQLSETGVKMSFNKGMYDAADALPGYRIAYFMVLESISELVKLVLWSFLLLLSIYVKDVTALRIIFILTAGTSGLTLLERFSALRPSKLARLLQ